MVLLEPLEDELNDLDEQNEEDDDKKVELENGIETKQLSEKLVENLTSDSSPINKDGQTNSLDCSPNINNETITSSLFGDITIDSVRDHLNSTTTTLCSTTTEEIVGRISVLSTQTSESQTIAQIKDASDLNMKTINNLSSIG